MKVKRGGRAGNDFTRRKPRSKQPNSGANAAIETAEQIVSGGFRDFEAQIEVAAEVGNAASEASCAEAKPSIRGRERERPPARPRMPRDDSAAVIEDRGRTRHGAGQRGGDR